MTKVYFVRHAQPDFRWEDDRTRPLTAEGMRDAARVAETLRDVPLDCAVCSPYRRSLDTIRGCAEEHGLPIETDERFRERQNGKGGNEPGMFQKRWADFAFHEDGGESLRMCQQRNVEALLELLRRHEGEQILLGTHGTAMSTMIQYFYSAYNCDNFLRMIDYMPYIVRLDFDRTRCVGGEELLIVEKVYRR